jgi:hypothetical protein
VRAAHCCQDELTAMMWLRGMVSEQTAVCVCERGRPTDSQIHRHTDTQTCRQIDRQTDRQTDKQTHRHTESVCFLHEFSSVVVSLAAAPDVVEIADMQMQMQLPAADAADSSEV